MRSKIVRIVLPFLFIVGVAFPALGQDTPTAEVPTAEPTVEVTPEETVAPVPTVAPEPTPEEPEAPRSLFTAAQIGELLLLLGLSALAGGGAVTILLHFIDRKDVKDRVEDARNSWTPEQQELLSRFTDMFENVTDKFTDFLKAVQDGKPNQ